MPSKKKPKAKKSTNNASPRRAANPRGNSQQLSDSLARQVARRRLTYDQAAKVQQKQDSIAMSKRKVNRTVRPSSQGLPTLRASGAAKYRLNRSGNIKRY